MIKICCSSSKISVVGLLYNTLAIDILWACPPEIFEPRSPIFFFRFE